MHKRLKSLCPMLCFGLVGMVAANAQGVEQAPFFGPAQRIESPAPAPYASTFVGAMAVDEGTVVLSAFGFGPAGGGLAPFWEAAAVYVQQNGQWTLQALLNEAGHVDSLPDFERTVAIKGDTIVIGDPNFGSTFEGRVYIYRRANAVWSLEATLTVPEESFFFRELGVAVAIDSVNDNRVLVAAGSSGREFPGGVQPTIYVFDRTSTGWTLQARLRPEELELTSLRAARIALRENLTVISVPHRAEAYTFTRQTDGSWAQGQTLWSPYRSEATGISIALDKDRMILGDDVSHLTFEYPEGLPVRVTNAEGDAYLFERGRGGRWVIKQKLRDVLLDAGLTEFHGIGQHAYLKGRLALISEGTGFNIGYPERVHVLKEEAGRWKLKQSLVSDSQTGIDNMSFDGTHLWVARNPFRDGRGYLEVFTRQGAD